MENQNFDKQVVFDVLPVSKPVPIPRPSTEIQMPAIVQPIALSPLVTLQESVVLKQADADYNTAGDYQPRVEDAANYKSKRGKIRVMGFLVMLFSLLFIAPFLLPMFMEDPISFEIAKGTDAVEADEENGIEAQAATPAKTISLSLPEPYNISFIIDWITGDYYKDSVVSSAADVDVTGLNAPDMMTLLMGGRPDGFDKDKLIFEDKASFDAFTITIGETEYTLYKYLTEFGYRDLSKLMDAPEGTQIYGFVKLLNIGTEEKPEYVIDGRVVEKITIVKIENEAGEVSYEVYAEKSGIVKSPALFAVVALLFAAITFILGLIALIAGGGKKAKRPLFWITAFIAFLAAAAIAVFGIVGLDLLGFVKPADGTGAFDVLLADGAPALVMAVLGLLLLLISIIATAVTKRKKGY
ncbi:MAG: hypothetical protein LBC13_02125 [Clostridiales bacterium]|jgi:hypothetical protein|nr:hypothetical protein [Clostridiales bacterium]